MEVLPTIKPSLRNSGFPTLLSSNIELSSIPTTNPSGITVTDPSIDLFTIPSTIPSADSSIVIPSIIPTYKSTSIPSFLQTLLPSSLVLHQPLRDIYLYITQDLIGLSYEDYQLNSTLYQQILSNAILFSISDTKVMNIPYMTYNQTLLLSYEVRLNKSISDCINYKVEFENMISTGIYNHILQLLLEFNHIHSIISSNAINVVCHDSVIESMQTSRLYNPIIHIQQQQQHKVEDDEGVVKQASYHHYHHEITPIQQPIISILPSNALKYGTYEKRSFHTTTTTNNNNNNNENNKYKLLYYYICIGLLTLVVLIGSIFSTVLKDMFLLQNVGNDSTSDNINNNNNDNNNSHSSSYDDVSNKFLSSLKTNSSASDLERAYQLNRRALDVLVRRDSKSEENSNVHVSIVNDN